MNGRPPEWRSSRPDLDRHEDNTAIRDLRKVVRRYRKQRTWALGVATAVLTAVTIAGILRALGWH